MNINVLANSSKNITAIILAGGKSSRMGREKGFVKLNGKPLIEHVIEKVKPLTDSVIIITNQSGYRRFGFACFPDIIKNCGPIGGIFTGLHHTTTKKNLVLSCDIPLIPETFLNYLVEQTGNEDALVPWHDGKTEPLCAVYGQTCKKTLKKLIDQRQFKLQKALKKMNTRFLDLSCFGGFEKKWFVNINTPGDLEKYQS